MSARAGEAPPARDDDALIARVRGCLASCGVDAPAWRTLLGLLAIEVTEAVPTAAVSVGTRSRLRINPSFVARHCVSDAALAMLVRHEMLHVLLGHTRLYRRHDLASNWAFDALINAQLARAQPDPVSLAFLREAAAGPGPCRLLAPPPGWPGPRAEWGDDAIGRVHRRLYEAGDVTLAELHALLEDVVRASLRGLTEADRGRLLGSHEPAEADAPAPWDARWAQAAEALGVDRLDGLERSRADARAAAAGGSRVTTTHRRTRDDAIAAAVHAALVRCADGAARRLAVRPQAELTVARPWPEPRDRAAAVRAALGVPTLLWQGTTRHPGPEADVVCRVYLDVSGSMQARLPALLDGLARAAHRIAWPLQAFSTEVVAVSGAALRAGRVAGTPGTALGCVLAHRGGPGDAMRLVVTDGMLEPVDPARVRAARRAGLRGELLVVPATAARPAGAAPAGAGAGRAGIPQAAAAWARALGWRVSVVQRAA